MLDVTMADDPRLLVETVRKFVTTEVQPLEREVEERGEIPADKLEALKAKAKSLGLYAMNMPQEVGGGGLSMVDICLVEEELGKTSDALIRRVFGQVYPMLMPSPRRQPQPHPIPTPPLPPTPPIAPHHTTP